MEMTARLGGQRARFPVNLTAGNPTHASNLSLSNGLMSTARSHGSRLSPPDPNFSHGTVALSHLGISGPPAATLQSPVDLRSLRAIEENSRHGSPTETG